MNCYKVISIALMALLSLTTTSYGVASSSYLTSSDQSRLVGIFQSALSSSSDGATLYHAVKGLRSLGAQISESGVCDKIAASVDESLESIFYASTTGSALGCAPSVDAEVVTSALAAPSSVTAMYHAVGAASALGLDIDAAAAASSLNALLKKDDGTLAMGYSFHIAAAIGGDIQRFFDNIEDVIEQADEVDGQFLQFEGGLYTSAVVVDGAFKLAQAAGSDAVAEADKIVQMANYFLSRKNVHHIKSASWMVSVIKTLSSNGFVRPVVVRRSSPVSIPTSAKKVVLSVTDLMGGAIEGVQVVADSLAKKGDSIPILAKTALTPISDDLFELDFGSSEANRGFYLLTVSASLPTPAAKEDAVAAPAAAAIPLIGNAGAQVELTVITEVSVENVEIGIADRDQSVAPKTTRVQYPNKVPTMLEVDSHQKVIMKFSLKDVNDASGAALQVHQAFVRLSSAGRDVFFVADVEPGTGLYKFDMDVGASAKEFASISGKYSMFLVVGDALIANPIAWEMVEMQLTFQNDPEPPASHSTQYEAKPEIIHMFREPEKRPPATVSYAFTALTVLPLLILVVVWKLLGVNVDGISLRNPLHVLAFHGTLASVFGLMYLYWTRLDMFCTLEILACLSVLLFLAGNRLLSSIAIARKAK